ncbi:MAG: response regulator [Lewinella sp.]|nr:response regulator [Lewinella sp.]
MRPLRCLIIEDEPLAAEILEDYIRDTPGLTLAGHCRDALYAMEFLRLQQVDLIFLDIHLPRLKGLEFLKTLSDPPKVILTTAYHEYALESYEYNVVDYLLKPIGFARFLKAVNKVRQADEAQPPAPARERQYRFFNVNRTKVKIYLDEILFVESLKEYVRIFTQTGTCVTKFQIGEVHAFFNDGNFIRIHRSFLVAKDKVKAFTASEVEVGNKRLPVGRSYRGEVLRLLER